MQISTLMNIHELALNKTVKQRSLNQAKRGQEMEQDNAFQQEQIDLKEKDLIGAPFNMVHQQADTIEEAQAEATVTGNIVNIHM